MLDLLKSWEGNEQRISHKYVVLAHNRACWTNLWKYNPFCWPNRPFGAGGHVIYPMLRIMGNLIGSLNKQKVYQFVGDWILWGEFELYNGFEMAPEANREKTNTGKVSFVFEILKTQKLGSVYWCCAQVPSANDVRQTIERTLKIPAPQNKSEPTIVSAIPRNTQIWGNILASYVDVLRGSWRVTVPRRGRNAWRTPKNVHVGG